MTKLVAQLSQYAFLAHCECRIGLHNSGPYNFGNDRPRDVPWRTASIQCSRYLPTWKEED